MALAENNTIKINILTAVHGPDDVSSRPLFLKVPNSAGTVPFLNVER